MLELLEGGGEVDYSILLLTIGINGLLLQSILVNWNNEKRYSNILE